MKPAPAPPAPLPVAVHRWFADGAGWSYHPALEPSIDALVTEVTSDLRSEVEGPFGPRAWNGGWIFGAVRNDPDCPNPKARNRGPTIFRVAYAPTRPDPDDLPDLLRALNALPLPAAPDGEPNLCVLPPAPPPDVVVPAYQRPVAPRGLVGRVWGAVLGERKAIPTDWPPNALAQALETAWAALLRARSRDKPGLLRTFLADDWRGFGTGPVVSRSAAEARPALADAFPPPRRGMDVISLHGDVLVVGGVTDGGERVVHVFTPNPDRTRWVMSFAQVIAGSPGALVSRPAATI